MLVGVPRGDDDPHLRARRGDPEMLALHRNCRGCTWVMPRPTARCAIPAIVIADLLGVPREDRAQFRRWSSTLIQSNPAHRDVGEGLSAAAEVYTYFADFLAERRRTPRDDLMSALVGTEIDEQKLSDD
jgi:cytochrome P450